MSSGPAPTPTAVLKLRGSWLAPRREKQGEPTPPPGRPKMPADLPVAAKRVWRYLVPMLEVMRVITQVDRHVIEAYCRCYVRWRELCKFVDENGEVYPLKDRDGKVTGFRAFPQSYLLIHVGDQLNRLCQQLGLSPAARARLRTEVEGAEDERDKRMFG